MPSHTLFVIEAQSASPITTSLVSGVWSHHPHGVDGGGSNEGGGGDGGGDGGGGGGGGARIGAEETVLSARLHTLLRTTPPVTCPQGTQSGNMG